MISFNLQRGNTIFVHSVAIYVDENTRDNGPLDKGQGDKQCGRLAVTVMPQNAAVFFPNLCRNHCQKGMLTAADIWRVGDRECLKQYIAALYNRI